MKHQTNPAPYARELYRGLELTRESSRPGAMDAYRLPSRRFNALVYPDGRRVTLHETNPEFVYATDPLAL